MYNPGALDQMIEVFRESTTDDEYGGETTTNTSIGRFWALVKPLSGGEAKDQDRVHDTGMYRFVIRHTNSILEDDFIIWNASEFNIRFIAQGGGRKLYLEIEAERNAQR